MNEDLTSETGVSSASDSHSYGSQREQLSIDKLHRILASERRRLILSYLATTSAETTGIDELINAVARREHPHRGPATYREHIEIDLHHVHLPKLADAGVIEYDPVSETVQYDGSEKLESLLETGTEVETEDE